MGRRYIWRHRGWWDVNTYGVIGDGGASIHVASQVVVVGGGVNTYGVIGGGGASIHMAP